MTTRTTWATTGVVLLLGGAGLAKEPEDVTKLPGYVAFDASSVFGDQNTITDIFITEGLINMVAAVSRHTDPELSGAIVMLKQIRMQTFVVESNQVDDLERTTSGVSHRLEQQGWQTMLRLRQPGQNKQTYVYTKWVDDKMQGLFVMDIDPRQASFVNIVGEIDPEQLQRISSKFSIDALDSLETEMHDNMHHKDRDHDKDKNRSKE